MSSSVSAIIIAAVGVLGTLAATIVSPLLATRGRREDFKLQKFQRQEEYARQMQYEEFVRRQSCYIAMMSSARHYRMELLIYLELAKRKNLDSGVKSELENSRKACLTSLAEMDLIASDQVRLLIGPINTSLSDAYSATKNLKAGKRTNRAYEEINRSLTELWNQWAPMADEMRRDLDIARRRLAMEE